MSPPAPTWNHVLDLAPSFSTRLRALKQSLSGECHWYPYETLSNLDHLAPVFAHSALPLAALAGGLPILDIGAGDGDLAFLLESAGFTVHALDHPSTSFNGMAGIRLLKQHLNSQVVILEADLNAPLNLDSYGLVFCLGVLYHVKSPLLLLEAIARAALHCVLSTRVARQSPQGARFEPHPVAYLLDDSQLNLDNSNYWIFTPSGLRRLARRAGWTTLFTSYIGDTRTSNPVAFDGHDERAFCLLKNRSALSNVELLHGWHDPEDSGWRWTAREFSLLALVPQAPLSPGSTPALPTPPLSPGFSLGPPTPTLQLLAQLFISGDLIHDLGPITLRCRVQGCPLPPRTFFEPGDATYLAPIPPAALTADSLLIEFSLDKALPPRDVIEDRELGLIVHSIDLSWL